jgi:parallel beta-helix repeat protein/predicted outer membrane repeat protein
MRSILFIVFALLAHSVLAQARTWQVTVDGSGDAPTVQAGIDSAGNGDIVLVGPGTYYENINLRGKALELRSSSGPQVTILDGSGGDNAVVTCDSGESERTVIAGLTITGGTGRIYAGGERLGGGIICQDSCARIRNNIIRENVALGCSDCISRGGALSFGGPDVCRVIVENNLFEANTARGNGGAINIGGPCVIRGNIFLRNTTVNGDGGAIWDINSWNNEVTIEGNSFIGNQAADHGGAILVARSHAGPASAVQITRNIFIGNSALTKDSGGHGCAAGAIALNGAGAVVTSNTLAFNSGSSTFNDAAGGICLYGTNADVLVENNILFRNYQGAVRTFGPSYGIVRHNLIFDNGQNDILVGDDSSLILEENLFEDPLFCILNRDSRGELAWYSPALHSPYGVIGAVDVGSCGPKIWVEVKPATWGRLKARYR